MHNCKISNEKTLTNISLTYSVFIIDSFNKILLVKKDAEKQLWDVPCYAKVLNPNDIIQTAEKQILNDLGIDCKLEESFIATRTNILPNGENELEETHVLIAYIDRFPDIFPSCILDSKSNGIVSICYEILSKREDYTLNVTTLMSKLFLKLNSH